MSQNKMSPNKTANGKKAGFSRAAARLDDASIAPLPMSEKIYVTGSRPDIRVPMRKIRQHDTPTDIMDI